MPEAYHDQRGKLECSAGVDPFGDHEPNWKGSPRGVATRLLEGACAKLPFNWGVNRSLKNATLVHQLQATWVPELANRNIHVLVISAV